MISDEAVEAAWVAYYQSGNDMRAILEAAAPYMMAQAWDEGAAAEFDRGKFDPHPANPYRSQS